jgi:hypothetical protein
MYIQMLIPVLMVENQAHIDIVIFNQSHSYNILKFCTL